MNGPPLVSCIMPTADRRDFVATAIRCFVAQDYPRLTLVVVDDGVDAVEDLMPDDPAVHYHRRPPGLPLGAKRNLACELAEGDIVVHWDDDDWSASWRVSHQVAALLDSGADVCGLATLLFRDVDGDRAYRYRYPQNGARDWVAGGTMAYRRDFWRRNPFPAVRTGEDTRFLWSPCPKRVLALPDDSFYVATIHRSNTSTRRPSGSRWKAVPVSEVERVMSTDQRQQTDRGTGSPAVTLSLPYYRAEDTIVGAVQSALAQTHRDLRLVVINDGDPRSPWPLLEHVDDERLVRFDLDTNHGRYFADAVVLAATDSPWFGVQDADDWSETERVARYLSALRERHAEFAIGAQQLHAGGRVSVETNDRVLEPLSERMRHIGHHCGLADTDVLRSIGGIHPGYRFGYDTLLVNLLRMAAPVAHVGEPLHHRRRHSGSLTSSPETGIGSPARLAAQRRLSALYQRARRCHQDYLAGAIDRTELRRRIGRLIRDDVDPPTATAVSAAAARLRQVLTAPVPPLITVPSRQRITVPAAPRSPVVGLGVLLDRAELWSDPCAVARETALELAAYLSARRPRRVLECGSGASTAVLARYAVEASASVVVLEHDRRRAERTRGLLRALGLGSGVEIVVTGLTRRRWADGGEHAWYDHPLDGDFDFVFVHGPPTAGGRAAAPFALRPHLTGDGELWIDDGREDELRCAALARELGVDVDLLPVSSNGLLRASPAAAVRRPIVDGREVTVSLLTGQRPRLLERTVSALLASAPGLLETAHVVVQVNSPDEETVGLVEGWDWVDELRVHAGSLLSIGDGTRELMARAAAASRPYVLHLEDDWVAGTADESWLGRARDVLDRNPDVGQVRLRHRGERVLPRHMVTDRPIRWTDRDGWAFAPAAHFTFNPSLVRRADLEKIFPASSQDAAQRRFLAARFATAQLSPGIFHHIGVESLRRRREGRTLDDGLGTRIEAHP
ncbi:Methyltransferase domain-containing protein [Geodermatophilus obscurus]|uniref:Methyltransferase domain-containing protein n=1 Tax=Geodermatophilus obscurus TaxID=1861 RepID=A0A1I5HPL5_9ACTN|nr:glycosyltransferase [Geodermatophilus obscurus]SFO50203.1 Methyltransferase domain-containing protein [Geodermatophilus obscurus]